MESSKRAACMMRGFSQFNDSNFNNDSLQNFAVTNGMNNATSDNNNFNTNKKPASAYTAEKTPQLNTPNSDLNSLSTISEQNGSSQANL